MQVGGMGWLVRVGVVMAVLAAMALSVGRGPGRVEPYEGRPIFSPVTPTATVERI